MRTFIAIGISSEVREKIAQIQVEFKKGDPDVKWVEPKNLHITLKFLGEVSEDKLSGVIEKSKLAVSGISSFRVHLWGLGSFPNLRSPRVVWIGVTEGKAELKNLSERIEENLSHLGFAREKREFSAHLTIGRVRSPRSRGKLVKKIEDWERYDLGEFPVDRILVMESQLSSKGPTYRIIEEVNLK
ncbi:RNA 2',3'-cyclic phosphodiesterase [bacterium]|nr:RNA 2',3'-cyclic phosphodiesterase [bacterium]NIN92402.1 RNA 2',3'-cyclic phosphodiesterase [bacterium]NIO18516.1 RNA 2',3'-cyclic phosphodiesterase [bacterium]NIO73512.1 RNA 2',3'-cyclic phosphodiesterase [bacterium]